MLLRYVNNPDNYLQQCEIYVQPPRSEGQAITVTEAKIFTSQVLTVIYLLCMSKSQIEKRDSCARLLQRILSIANEDLRYQLVKNLDFQPQHILEISLSNISILVFPHIVKINR